MSRRISLVRELDVIRGSVSAVLLLVDDLQGVDEGRHTAHFAASMRACLVLIETRLRDLDRLARRELDPEVAWISHTTVADIDANDGDIVFEWEDKQSARYHKRELRRLQLLTKWRKRKRRGGASR